MAAKSVAGGVAARPRRGRPGVASARSRPPPAASSSSFLVHGRARRGAATGSDGERPGDAHAGAVLVGAVVEQLDVGALGDGGVDGGAGGRCGPPTRRHAAALGGPGGAGLAGDLPLLPGSGPSSAFSAVRSGSSVACAALPQHVDLGVVGDGFKRDVGSAFVDEALAEVVVGRGCRGLDLPEELGLLGPAFAAVGKQVVGVAWRPSAGCGRGRARRGRCRW